MDEPDDWRGRKRGAGSDYAGSSKRTVPGGRKRTLDEDDPRSYKRGSNWVAKLPGRLQKTHSVGYRGRVSHTDDVDVAGGDGGDFEGNILYIGQDKQYAPLGGLDLNYVDGSIFARYDGGISLNPCTPLGPILQTAAGGPGTRVGNKIIIKGVEFRFQAKCRSQQYVSNAGFSWAGVAAILPIPGITAVTTPLQLRMPSINIPPGAVFDCPPVGGVFPPTGTVIAAGAGPIIPPTVLGWPSNPFGQAANLITNSGFSGTTNGALAIASGVGPYGQATWVNCEQPATDGRPGFPQFPAIVLPPTVVNRGYAAGTVCDTRILILMDTQPDGTNPSAATVMQQGSGFLPNSCLQYNTTVVPQRFMILYDTMFTNPSESPSLSCVEVKIRINRPMVFDSNGFVKSGQVYLLVLGSDAYTAIDPPSVFELDGTIRMYYSDE